MKNSFFLLLLILLFTGCKKDELYSGDIGISEVDNKTNYQAPLKLVNDLPDKVTLNGVDIEFENGIFVIEDAGFYEMIRSKNDTVLFVLLDQERREAEWGLKKWTPEIPIFNLELKPSTTFFHPKQYYPGISVPIVVQQKNWDYLNTDNMKGELYEGEQFNIKKGMGSCSVKLEDSKLIGISINAVNTLLSLNKITFTPIQLEVNIESNVLIERNSLVHITTDISVASTGSLTFKEGCIVLIDEGVNIYNEGSIIIRGSEANPLLFTCRNSDEFWGGFISVGDSAKIQAEYCFFTRFSHHDSSNYQYGHAKHQALFKAKNTKLEFNYCWFLDTPGQVFYPENCELSIRNCMVQRAKTGGQVNNSSLTIVGSYFSDFPDDNQGYRDEDNDALYISGSDANIAQSVFMHAKDDGIDSGGGEGGEVLVENCWIESCFHEGLAFSSNNPVVKNHLVKGCVIQNCQQGIELGYSSPNHLVTIRNCFVTTNYIGIRYGDNYKWSINGKMFVSQSDVINNERNSWNMVHEIWAAKPTNLSIEN